LALGLFDLLVQLAMKVAEVDGRLDQQDETAIEKLKPFSTRPANFQSAKHYAQAGVPYGKQPAVFHRVKNPLKTITNPERWRSPGAVKPSS